MNKKLLRGLLFVLALLLLAAPIVGIYVFLKSRQPASPAAPVVVGQPGEGLERAALGIYLGTRDADLRKPAGSNPAPVTFVVKPGQTAEEIGRSLQAAGLINDAELFRQLAKYLDVSEHLEAGEYQLRATMTMEEIITTLQKSVRRDIRVTIREGWRLGQSAEEMAKNGLSTTDDLLKAMQTNALSYSILSDRPAGVSLEGYVFPDTYIIDARWSAEQMIDLMVATMDRRFTAAMRQQATARGLTVHQVLTVASLVEREAVLASERPTIAGVYLNRLAKKMALEADSTVQYALGYDKEQDRWWPNIKLAQLRSTESPYNTYLRRDLPPGPICSPGLSSIQAVLQPAKTDYLFYYAKGDGSHAFAKTFEEHLENQKKYSK